MIALSDELPYGIAVEIERFEPTEDGRTEIDAVIWVERVGQRKIVIGAKGERLKSIGRAARLALNELFGRRVHLAPGSRCARAGATTTRCCGGSATSRHERQRGESSSNLPSCCITGPGATRAGFST